MFARNGRPPEIAGSHSGMCGSVARVCCTNGWNAATASASSPLAPKSRTPSGVDALQGAAVHR